MVVYVVKSFWKLKKRPKNSGSEVSQFSWQRIPTHMGRRWDLTQFRLLKQLTAHAAAV